MKPIRSELGGTKKTGSQLTPIILRDYISIGGAMTTRKDKPGALEGLNEGGGSLGQAIVTFRQL